MFVSYRVSIISDAIKNFLKKIKGRVDFKYPTTNLLFHVIFFYVKITVESTVVRRIILFIYLYIYNCIIMFFWYKIAC